MSKETSCGSNHSITHFFNRIEDNCADGNATLPQTGDALHQQSQVTPAPVITGQSEVETSQLYLTPEAKSAMEVFKDVLNHICFRLKKTNRIPKQLLGPLHVMDRRVRTTNASDAILFIDPGM